MEPLESPNTYDSHVSCMMDIRGIAVVMFVGNVRSFDGKAIPKDKPLLLYTCPCQECIQLLDSI
jgi:hypothetical protein